MAECLPRNLKVPGLISSTTTNKNSNFIAVQFCLLEVLGTYTFGFVFLFTRRSKSISGGILSKLCPVKASKYLEFVLGQYDLYSIVGCLLLVYSELGDFLTEGSNFMFGVDYHTQS